MPSEVTYNPGEPVFDQSTGEPYIDEEGSFVEVAPLLKVQAPDGRTLEGDDVGCAAWYRANKFRGETLRDRRIGVPYDELVLGTAEPGLAINAVVSEVLLRTPGLAAVTNVAGTDFSPTTRVLRFRAAFLKRNGRTIQASVQSGG